MIQMLHVFKSFAAHSLALEDITFRVEAGEFAVLTGPSGAGKTTLLTASVRGGAAGSWEHHRQSSQRHTPGPAPHSQSFDVRLALSFKILSCFPPKLPLKMLPSHNGSWRSRT